MHEDIDGSVRGLGGEDIEAFHRAGAIGEAPGRAEARAHKLAVAGAALEHVIAVGRIDGLVVGVVELLLVHVEPDQRPLDPRRLCRPLRQCRPGCAEQRGTAADQGPPRHRMTGRIVIRWHVAPTHAAGVKPICARAARPSRP